MQYAVDTQADAVGIVRWFRYEYQTRVVLAQIVTFESATLLWADASPEQLRAMSVVCDWRDLPFVGASSR
ncbi:hypothetical protein EIMP300_80730 [Escherichia coli]|uniref:Uncharacterized protein n=1 Tax=Escherichia coli TaxID=562 RepID=A0A8S0G4C9_ECOLX|nr:hypothetical protein EIMP300_80730 [Escherichia coli]